MSQMLNTMRQIWNNDGVSRATGLWRHALWQCRRVLGLFPCELMIGTSKLYVARPMGVPALVNAMGEYDFNNMSLLRLGLGSDGSTFVDVGANIGTYTLIASETPKTRVVSVEPHPATFVLLNENVLLNGRQNVVCLNVALSREEGNLLLTDFSEPALNQVVSSEEHTRGIVGVKGRRFDTVCREFGVFPDFVKIDVEGHERSVLEGFGEFRTTAKAIFVEGGERKEIRSWLKAAEYSGPWYVHFNDRVFSRRPQDRPEDPVFVRPDFVLERIADGFQFVDTVGGEGDS